MLRASSSPVQSGATQTVDFDLPLKPFIDGGWYWFDLEAGDGELVLEEAVWGVETEKTAHGRVTIGITTFNRPDFCVDAAAEPGDRPGRARDPRRGHRDRPGHPEGERQRALRRGGRGARRQAPHHRAGQPRRLGRLLPRHERGRRAGRLRLRPAPRRRRGLRARGRPARGHVRRPREAADAGRWADVQPLRPLGDARVRRDAGPVQVVLGPGAAHRARSRLRQAVAAVDAVAAPPRGRGLQRLVDVPHPHRA